MDRMKEITQLGSRQSSDFVRNDASAIPEDENEILDNEDGYDGLYDQDGNKISRKQQGGNRD